MAFDVSRQTFRSEQYAEYKANRSTSPAEFSGQVGLIKEVLAALRVPFLEKEGYEADDIIATLHARPRRQGFEVVLVSRRPRLPSSWSTTHTTLLYPVRGVSELTG